MLPKRRKRNEKYAEPNDLKYNEGNTNKYKKIAEGIYSFFDEWECQDFYVTSLKFEQEPDLGEGSSPKNISQYPLEDILDKFNVSISDSYDELNEKSDITCYQEFCSYNQKDIENLREIIGKHVYNKTDGKNSKLIIE